MTGTNCLRELTSKKHFLEQIVNLGHAEEFDKLNLLDHLPGDALQCWQQQEQLSEATPRVVLPVVDVVFQADLDLVAHALDLSRIAQTFSICGEKRGTIQVYNEGFVFQTLTSRELIPGSKKTMAFKQAYSLSSIWSSWKGRTSSSRILTATLPTSNSGQFLGIM